MKFKQNPGIPFPPERLPFFYGWFILFAGMIGIVMSIPGQTMGVSVFTDHLIGALPLTRSQLSLAYMLGTVMSGFLITRAGKYYDKYGARVMGMLAGVMLGLMLVYMARSDRILIPFLGENKSEWSIGWVLAIMVFGFFGIRFFGQGIMTMVSRNMLMKWFEHRRGLANAIVGVFVSFSFSAAPGVFNAIMNRTDWRTTWLILAAVVGIGFVAFVFLFFRDNPQASGLKPDGKLSRKATEKGPKYKPDRQYTLHEAVRTYSFWIFNLNLALNAMFITALTFHVVSIFGEAGYDETTALSIFIPISVVAVTFNLTAGTLSDYIRLKYLLLVNLMGTVITGIALFYLDYAPAVIILLIGGVGMSNGLFGVLNTVTWPRFFGTLHLGAISGFSMSWLVIGSAVGPYLYSLSLRDSGSYGLAGLITSGVALVLWLLALKANNVNEKKKPATAGKITKKENQSTS